MPEELEPLPIAQMRHINAETMPLSQVVTDARRDRWLHPGSEKKHWDHVRREEVWENDKYERARPCFKQRTPQRDDTPCVGALVHDFSTAAARTLFGWRGVDAGRGEIGGHVRTGQVRHHSVLEVESDGKPFIEQMRDRDELHYKSKAHIEAEQVEVHRNAHVRYLDQSNGYRP